MSKNTPKINRLFYDIETSPNIGMFWRAGYDQNILHDSIIEERKIITIAYKWDGYDTVNALEWDKNMDDKEMLKGFLEVLSMADEAVAHYGDRFDFPWIKTRALFHGLNPMPLVKTIDTKKMASSNFYFNSNKLDYLAKFLGSTGKLKTTYSLWRDICLKNDRKALAYMVKYNKKDVTELEFVYKKLAKWCKPKTHVGVANNRDKWTCPRTGSTNVNIHGVKVTAGGVKQYQMQNMDNGTYYSISAPVHEQYAAWRKDKADKANEAKNKAKKK